jgi:GT2 family glycosyltransferase
MNASHSPGLTRASSISAIVVHHKSYETVVGTVSDLVDAGVDPQAILVVDNSEDPDGAARLRSSIPAAITVLFVPNDGYGAAMNLGVQYFMNSEDGLSEYIVLASHETRIDRGSLDNLVSALMRDEYASVAGPTILSGDSAEPFVWSEGGGISSTGAPYHHGHRRNGPSPLSVEPTPREWLDGAFLLYRAAELRDFPFSDRFFLYMEETDQHLRLQAAGKRILWVPSSTAWQSSNGVPEYHYARNIRLLARRHYSFFSRRIGVPYLLFRRFAVLAIRRREGLPNFLRGIRARLQDDHYDLVIVNPLGGTLAHYQSELVHTAASLGRTFRVISFDEPSISGRSRLAWLWDYVRALRLAASLTGRGSNGVVIVIWPVLGYLDFVLARILAGRSVQIVMHDPEPLVEAVGYNSISRRLAGALGKNVEMIVHSPQAYDVVDRDNRVQRTIERVAHPLFVSDRQLRAARDRGSNPSRVLVLGQFKPDRDIDALIEIARDLKGAYELIVRGRGWPNVDGWNVIDEFVHEAELDEVIRSANVVVIPYKKFFQSGVAIRALENGVPVVGPRDSSLSDLLGADSPLLVPGPGHWARSVKDAISMSSANMRVFGGNLQAASVNEWRSHLSRQSGSMNV